MEIRLIENKNEWERFVLGQEYTLFTQSSHYIEFYEKMGEAGWVFGCYDNGILVGGALGVSVHARRGNFLFIPYGPLFGVNNTLEKNKEIFSTLFSYLKNFSKKNNFNFIRVSPFLEEDSDYKEVFSEFGFRTSPIHILAENTWILSLEEKTEDDLLVGMEKGHRNLIRRCIKEGVTVGIGTEEKDINNFNQLHDETAKKHHFSRFSESYIKNEFNSFAPHGEAVIFNAFLADGRLDSSAVIMFYGNMAAYRHGASLNLDHKIPTSYLVQWEVIKEAKKRGVKYYNFWGVTPDHAKKNHPFRGITHFKKGFGGSPKDLIWCQDLPINYKYCFTWLIETLRRIKRGF